MRQGICWVLGFAMIVAGVGNPDYGLSKVISAKLPIHEQTNQSNAIQPFVIVGEGIDNIVHIEPIPGGKLLAQTPLSYRLVDPQTGKMEKLPQGFPEGEITQWEEDYAVVRTIANQAKPVTYLYTIWPTMARCLTPKKYICFTDKHGAYASFELEGDRKSGLLKYYDSEGKLVWDKLIQQKSFYGDYGILRVFDNKLFFGFGSDYNLMIFDLANGESVAQGNSYYIFYDSYYSSKFSKPVKGGSFYIFENGLITPKTTNPSNDDPKFSATKEGFEAAWIKDNELKYSYCTGNDGAALYTCSVDTKSLPCPLGDVRQVQNGIILINCYDYCCYFVDAYTGKVLETINVPNTQHLWSFRQDNTICMVANGTFHFFDTVTKKMRNKFNLPMFVRTFGENTLGYTSSEKGGKKGFEVFDTRDPGKKAFVGVPFFGASCSKRGIITWHDRVKKGEILGHLHKYEGGMEPLAFADTVIDTYWIGEHKGEIYGLFGYWWWDLWKTMIAIAKLENGKWVRKITVANTIYLPFNYLVSDGRILTVEHGSMNVVKLDEMKEYSYPILEGYTSLLGYWGYAIKILDDCVVVSKPASKDTNKPDSKCSILDLKTGKTTTFEKFIGYCSKYVLGSNEGKFYKYMNGTLEEIGEVKLPIDYNHDFSDYGYKLTTEDVWYTNSSSKRDLEVKVWEQSNGWTQSIPVTTYQYTSMPPELYPWNGFYTTYAKPNPSWLPKMKKCASFKVKINKAKNGEFECEFDVQGADLLGRIWFATFNESKEIAFLDKPRELAAKVGHKTRLSFPSAENEMNPQLALVMESNGFLDVQGTYENEDAKSQLPLFAGMQAGPSGNNVVNAFFWEAQKGDAP